MSTVANPTDAAAFPHLTPADMALLRPMSTPCSFKDGETIFRAGDPEIDLFVVESGGMEIVNPADGNESVVTHGPGQFSGDIDLLTRRPVLVTAIARGQTELLRIPGARLHEIMNKLPHLAEIMLVAIQERRRLLSEQFTIGLKVVGPGKCKDTMLVREFLFKNFVPFNWFDSASEKGKELMTAWGSPQRSPVIEFNDGRHLVNPSLRDLAQTAGVWRHCPPGPVDLAIIGAGPAGMAAAVYAASEGVSTVVLDRVGPGGQASASSRIENFIGFPSGLSGAELATRSALQMLKFGASMVAPVIVENIEAVSKPEEGHILHLDCGTDLFARTVLIAAGVRWRKLDAEGAERFESQGIHYSCTAVESVLYDNQDVAVVGAGNSAGQAAMYLAECCSTRTVHLLVRGRLGPSMSDYLVERIRGASNIVVREGEEITALHGTPRLSSVTLKSGKTIPLSAVFVFIGAEPGAAWLPEGIVRDKLGYILTGIAALQSGRWPLQDREPCALETTVPGILAAGDIRAGSTKRVGFAVGDGSLAVTCVHQLTAIRA
ncbi:MAG TPA: FAD-dependent oxidoreductase [Terriglobia bacterium]|nr:FAD-dependent oxidoreductase [Terriglobia bacterium]